MYGPIEDKVNNIESSKILMSPVLNSLKILNTLNVLNIRNTPLFFSCGPAEKLKAIYKSDVITMNRSNMLKPSFIKSLNPMAVILRTTSAVYIMVNIPLKTEKISNTVLSNYGYLSIDNMIVFKIITNMIMPSKYSFDMISKLFLTIGF